MIRWHFSKLLRDFLADLPEVNRENLVRTLGKFPKGDLPSADNSRWVVQFDTQSGLRGVLEADVVEALKKDHVIAPSWTDGAAGDTGMPLRPRPIKTTSSELSRLIPEVPGLQEMIKMVLSKVEGLAMDQEKMTNALRDEIRETRSSIMSDIIEKSATHAAPEKPWEAFYCYNSEDLAVVEAVCQLLTDRSVRGWRDRNNLIPGDQFIVEIKKIIDQSGSAVVFLGPAKLGKFQRHELAAIQAGGISRIIPCLLPEYQMPTKQELERVDELELLNVYHWIDFREFTDLLGLINNGDDQEAFQRFIKLIFSLIEAIRKGLTPPSEQ